MAHCLSLLIFAMVVNTLLCERSNTDCINNLIEWIKSNGGDISNSIEIRTNNIKTRGVYTTNTISPNAMLATIPISLLFTLENARKTLKNVLPTNKQEFLTNLGPIDTLSLALIMEHQNEDSFWSPYLKCLPSMNDIKNELQHPLYWSQQEINEYLQTSKVATFITRRSNSIKQSFNEINTVFQSISYLQDMLTFTLDHWIWALSIVWSRSFSVIIEKQKIKVSTK